MEFKGLVSKFKTDVSRIRHKAPKEDRRVERPKRCDKNKQDEESGPKNGINNLKVNISTSGNGSIENVFGPCENFRCENDGQCITIVSGQDGNETKHAKCVCHDRWIGPRCEALLTLSPRRVTDFSVELRVGVQNENMSQWLQKKYLKYTLQYWSNDSDTSCYKIPEITNITYEISDLTSGIFYHFCARTDIVAKCATNPKDPLALGSNCIGIVTRLPGAGEADKTNSIPIIPIVISIVLLLGAMTAFAVVFKCGYNLFNECSCSSSRSVHSILCCQRDLKPAYDLFILPDNACANVNTQTPLMDSTQQHLQNPQSLTSLTQASVSTPASATFFPLATDRNHGEQNPVERMVPLMSQANVEEDGQSPEFIQFSI